MPQASSFPRSFSSVRRFAGQRSTALVDAARLGRPKWPFRLAGRQCLHRSPSSAEGIQAARSAIVNRRSRCRLLCSLASPDGRDASVLLFFAEGKGSTRPLGRRASFFCEKGEEQKFANRWGAKGAGRRDVGEMTKMMQAGHWREGVRGDARLAAEGDLFGPQLPPLCPRRSNAPVQCQPPVRN